MKRVPAAADKAFYVTTPIYYVNDAPHIGHALHDGDGRHHHPVAPPARRGRLVPHRHRRARPQGAAQGRAERRDPAGVGRPADRERVDAGARDDRRRQRRLHPHHRAAAPRRRAGVLAGPLRPGRRLQGRVLRLLQRRQRGVRRRRRRGRRRGRRRRVQDLHARRQPGRAHDRGELLLQAVGLPAAAARPLRVQPRLHPPGVGPQRGDLLREPRAQGPVDVAVDVRLGHPGAVGREARHVRLDRGAAQLRDRRSGTAPTRSGSTASGRPTSTSSARTSPASTRSSGRRC